MSVESILSKLQEKLDLSMYELSKKLGLKSRSHVAMLKKGCRKPNFETCYKIIKLGNQLGITITLDMLRGTE